MGRMHACMHGAITVSSGAWGHKAGTGFFSELHKKATCRGAHKAGTEFPLKLVSNIEWAGCPSRVIIIEIYSDTYFQHDTYIRKWAKTFTQASKRSASNYNKMQQYLHNTWGKGRILSRALRLAQPNPNKEAAHGQCNLSGVTAP